MTDKELKKILKSAYAVSETDTEKRFVRKYEKRSLQTMEIIKLEFKYMGLKSILSGIVLCIVLLFATKMNNEGMIWAFSSMIPFGAVVPMILLSNSERHGMDELEASSRFSLRFVRLVRMIIIGILTLGLFISIGIILKSMFVVTEIEYLICVIIPYLVSNFGAIHVTRKWHGKGNIFGIFAICTLSSIVSFALRAIRNAGHLPGVVYVVMASLLIVAVITECIKYVKESENLSWNLC